MKMNRSLSALMLVAIALSVGMTKGFAAATEQKVNKQKIVTAKGAETNIDTSYEQELKADKREVQIMKEKQGWGYRAGKYINTTMAYYERAVKKYEADQKEHKSPTQLKYDQAEIERAKQKVNVAMADERKSQAALTQAEAKHKGYESVERHQAAEIQDQQADNLIKEKQVWGYRSTKNVNATKAYYERAVQRYEADQKHHASATQLKADQAEVQRAKSHLDKAIADDRKSQSALAQAEAKNKAAEGSEHPSSKK